MEIREWTISLDTGNGDYYEDVSGPDTDGSVQVVEKSEYHLLVEGIQSLMAKYEERGIVMRETGSMVRSLFMPYINRIANAVRQHGSHRDTITEIQDALDELNKHTPIGGR